MTNELEIQLQVLQSLLDERLELNNEFERLETLEKDKESLSIQGFDNSLNFDLSTTIASQTIEMLREELNQKMIKVLDGIDRQIKHLSEMLK